MQLGKVGFIIPLTQNNDTNTIATNNDAIVHNITKLLIKRLSNKKILIVVQTLKKKKNLFKKSKHEILCIINVHILEF